MKRFFIAIIGLAWVGVIGCRQAPTIIKKPSVQLIDPVNVYGPLFDSVQLAAVFLDSKTFPDCYPKTDPASIVNAFQSFNSQESSLENFVMENFTLPEIPQTNFSTDTSMDVLAHIERLWPVLSRDKQATQAYTSRILLPEPYIVPGGRFSEIYYWDSYFTMLGLKQSTSAQPMIRNMIENFAFLIDSIGFVPNGNRTYYLSRSQPPFFSSMVRILASIEGEQVLVEFLPAMEKEYAFWMNGSDMEGERQDSLHVVKLLDKEILNRYFDQQPLPRPEAFKEDIELAGETDRPASALYSNLRSACESGWDFSSRWCEDPQELGTIRTTALIPTDLNSLLYSLEETISKAYLIQKDSTQGNLFALRAANRKSAMIKYLWNEELGIFADYHWKDQTTTGIPTLAMAFPLYFGIAQPEQAAGVAAYVEEHFLRDGGVVTTLVNNGQQWDAPNGWAPLQWICIRGLRNYGFDDLADNIRDRWIRLNVKVFEDTGRLLEKYNVEDTTLLAGGGEYPNQDGFGWTNGVLMALMKEKRSQQ